MLKSGIIWNKFDFSFDSSVKEDNAHLVPLYLWFFSTITLFYQWQQQEAENAIYHILCDSEFE